MGVSTGPITYRRYRVVGELPENYRELYLQAVADRVHREIEEESDDERSWGWVVCGELLDTEITTEKLFVDDALVLTMRVDSLKVPSGPLNLYVRAAEREFMRSTGKEKLGKRDREEIKDRVAKMLRKRILPSIKGVDFAWSLSEGVLRLWTHNKTLAEGFMGLFQDTFGLRLVPRTPYTALADVGFDEASMDAVLGLEPADFTVPPSDEPPGN